MALSPDLLAAPKLARTDAGLQPYVPSPDQPWDTLRAGHLLRRTLIGPQPSEITQALRSTPHQVVKNLLFLPTPPDPPGDWVNQDPFIRPTRAQRQLEREWMDEIRAWWMEKMVNLTPTSRGFSIRERMVLFWHNHFATQAIDVPRPQLMYIQNTTLRKHALGNFKTLVQDITRDPAMLYYLDGRVNQKGKPNENYARELMELFTMGIGNYTEEDVGEAARALTGWVVQAGKAVFYQRRFDPEKKTFLGHRGNFNDTDIIDIIFEQEATATFICRKLYQAFVYDIPDESVVDQMARLLRENNYEIRPVMEALLTSMHFLDKATIGAKIKSPVELIAGTARTLGMWAGSDRDIQGAYMVHLANTLGQHLLDPPNVAGWPGYRTWISTSTLPQRHKVTDEITDGKIFRIRRTTYRIIKPDPVTFIKTFPDPYDAVKLIREMGACLTPFEVRGEREELFLSALLQGAATYDWNPDDPAAPRRISGLLKMIFELPEYQLG